MKNPLFKRIEDFQQPTSIKDDEKFAGHRWELFEAEAIIQGKGDQQHGHRYVKVPESLIKYANVAVVHEGAAMFLQRNQTPDEIRSASYRNPRTLYFYRWLPALFLFDGRWVNQSEYVRAVMPNHVSPPPLSDVPKTAEYWKKRHIFSQSGGGGRVDYECTCPAGGHYMTIFKELGERKWVDRCPLGNFWRVVDPKSADKVKYVCDCGKKHFRLVGEGETVPDQCPDGGKLAAEGSP